jgi:hypothetical protein
MLRIPTQLPDELERLVHSTIGCCIQVHRILGPGLLEQIYVKAICLELEASGIPFEREKPFPVFYRGHLLCEQRVDLVVGVSSSSRPKRWITSTRYTTNRFDLAGDRFVFSRFRGRTSQECPFRVFVFSWLKMFYLLPLALHLVQRHILHHPP